MLNKAYALSLLAATLIFAPTVATANQVSDQEINQTGTAYGSGSRVEQDASQRSSQSQRRRGYQGDKYSPDSQRQRSRQLINQDGYAEDGGRVRQRASQRSRQRQNIENRSR